MKLKVGTTTEVEIENEAKPRQTKKKNKKHTVPGRSLYFQDGCDRSCPLCGTNVETCCSGSPVGFTPSYFVTAAKIRDWENKICT